MVMLNDSSGNYNHNKQKKQKLLVVSDIAEKDGNNSSATPSSPHHDSISNGDAKEQEPQGEITTHYHCTRDTAWKFANPDEEVEKLEKTRGRATCKAFLFSTAA